MWLKRLSIVNFRNVDKQDLQFSPHINCFVGVNGQGKTNFLEAISLLANSKSFRTNRLDPLIKWGENLSRLEGVVEKHDSTYQLAMAIESGKKVFFIGDKQVTSLLEYLGNLIVLTVTPQDIEIVEGSPKCRRDYIDRLIFLDRKQYLTDYQNYYRVLAQRNRLLKSSDKGMIEKSLVIWDEQLVKYGLVLMEERSRKIEQLNLELPTINAQIGSEDERLELVYQPNVKEAGREQYLTTMNDSRYTDLGAGYTGKGPHRDDIDILLSGEKAKIYASIGQKRTIIYSLILGAAAIFHKRKAQSPILIFDDLEVDAERSSRILALIQEKHRQNQVFISSMQAHKFDSLDETTVYKVEKGKATIPSIS